MGHSCRIAVLAGSVLLLGIGTAAAQMSNYDFDNNMAAMLGRMQQQNTAGMQQLWQTYLQQNGARLQAEYQQLVARGQAVGTFEQYAYWSLMTANGTDLNTWKQQSDRNFQALQDSHTQVMQGYQDYNRGWQNNSDRQTQAVENYTNQAVRGNSPFANPDDGETLWLPNNRPPGQAFSYGGNIYVQDQSGNYYQRQGNQWVQLEPQEH